MVTAPKSGAEIIPFLKTYVNLPGAIAFTVLYGSLSNRFSQPQVFRGVVSTFLGFFACFAWVLYPNIGSLHPHGLADAAARILPRLLPGADRRHPELDLLALLPRGGALGVRGRFAVVLGLCEFRTVQRPAVLRRLHAIDARRLQE